MKKVLILNGPNINMLGVREPEIYGNKTYQDLCDFLRENAKKLGLDIEIFQSNHEGMLIDILQDKYQEYKYLIINAGGLTHTSVSLRDAIKGCGYKMVSVHLTDINARDEFRKINYLKDIALKEFVGEGFNSYLHALEFIKNN